MSSIARKAIRERLEAAWADKQPDVPLFWQNEYNELPDNAPFLFIEVLFDGEEFSAFGGGIGNNEWLRTGSIQGHVLVPVHEGVDKADTLAEDFASILRGQRFNSVSCFAASQMGGDKYADNGNYWRQSVAVDFEFRFKG